MCWDESVDSATSKGYREGVGFDSSVKILRGGVDGRSV